MRVKGGKKMDSIDFIEKLNRCYTRYKRGLISLKELEDIVYQLSFEITYNLAENMQLIENAENIVIIYNR